MGSESMGFDDGRSTTPHADGVDYTLNTTQHNTPTRILVSQMPRVSLAKFLPQAALGCAQRRG